VPKVLDRVKATFVKQRERRPWLDHLVRMKNRYDEVRGDRLAGAVTYFGFLSFFPILAIGYAVLGFLVRYVPDVEQNVTDFIVENIPGIDVAPILNGIQSAAATAAVVGLVGLLFAGLGWLNALREALLTVFEEGRRVGNAVTQRLADLAALVALGLTVLVSLAISNIASSATQLVLGWLDLQDNLLGTILLRVLAIALALVTDMLVFVVTLRALSGADIPRSALLRGALLGAIGVEILKQLGGLLVSRSAANPVYGSFALVVGLLIWINLIARLTMYVSCWTYTAYAGPSPAADLPQVVEVPITPAGRKRTRSRLAAAAAAAGGVIGYRIGRRRAGSGKRGPARS
jgi:membrane protein